MKTLIYIVGGYLAIGLAIAYIPILLGRSRSSGFEILGVLVWPRLLLK